jgi:RND family efflux transporter MFP subunit
MKPSPWSWRLAAGAIVALLAAGYLTAQQPPAATPVAALPNTFEGFTRPSLEVTVGSRVEGIVAEVLVKEGQTVKKGDVLVRLDDSIEKLEVALSRLQAEADQNLEGVRLIAKQKETELERGKNLKDKGTLTGVEYEQLELQLKVAQLNVAIAESKQQAAKLQLEKDMMRLAQREIRSPTDGVVTRLYKDPGEAVERLEKVAEVVQLSPLEIVLNVPVATRGRYKTDQPARVRLADAADWHAATVTMVDPMVDFASNTYRVKVRLPNGDGKLQAGLRVTVDLGPQ